MINYRGRRRKLTRLETRHDTVLGSQNAEWRNELKTLVSEIDSHFTHPWNVRWINHEGEYEFTRPLSLWKWRMDLMIDAKCSTKADFQFLEGRFKMFLKTLERGESFLTEEEGIPPELLPKFRDIGDDLDRLKKDQKELHPSENDKTVEDLKATLGCVSSSLSKRKRDIYHLRD